MFVERSEFKAITAFTVLELTCAKVEDEQRVTGGKSTTNYWVTNAENAALYVDGVEFDSVTSACRGDVGKQDTCGGAIWVQGGAKLLSVLNCRFRNCSTVEGTSYYMGGCILSGALDTIFNYCTVENCHNERSIVYIKKTGSAQPIESKEFKGLIFTDVWISPTKADDASVAGGSGFVAVNVEHLTLTDCHFSNVAKKPASNLDYFDGGCYLAIKQGSSTEITDWVTSMTLTLKDCTFRNATARRGGCFAIRDFDVTSISVTNTTFELMVASGTNDRDGGGVFFVTSPPGEMIIKDCCFKDASAFDGAVLYRYGAAMDSMKGTNFTKFAMTNTTVDNCQPSGSGKGTLAINIQSGGTCEFNNNTLKRLPANAITVSGVAYDEVVLSDWTFESISCQNFILNMGEQLGDAFKFKRCVLKQVTSQHLFNGHAKGRFMDMTFEGCTLDQVSSADKTFWIDMYAGSRLTLNGCTIRGECTNVLALFRFVSATVEIRDCVFQDLTGPDGVFLGYI